MGILAAVETLVRPRVGGGWDHSRPPVAPAVFASFSSWLAGGVAVALSSSQCSWEAIHLPTVATWSTVSGVWGGVV